MDIDPLASFAGSRLRRRLVFRTLGPIALAVGEPTVKLHWHLHYSNKTAYGMLAYKTSVSGEYDTTASGIIECAEDQSTDGASENG